MRISFRDDRYESRGTDNDRFSRDHIVPANVEDLPIRCTNLKANQPGAAGICTNALFSEKLMQDTTRNRQTLPALFSFPCGRHRNHLRLPVAALFLHIVQKKNRAIPFVLPTPP